MSRPHKFIELEPLEKVFLKDYITKGESRALEQTRSRILLMNDSGKTATEIASVLALNYVSVTQILRRYREEGLNRALYDSERCGAPRKITPELEAQVTAIACSEAPDGRVRWTVELLTDEIIRLQVIDTISTTSIHTILKKVNSNRGSIKSGALKR